MNRLLPAPLVSLLQRPARSTRLKHTATKRTRQRRPVRPNLAYHIHGDPSNPIKLILITSSVTKQDVVASRSFSHIGERQYYELLLNESGIPGSISVLFYRFHWWPDVNSWDEALPFIDQPKVVQEAAILNLTVTLDSLPDLKMILNAGAFTTLKRLDCVSTFCPTYKQQAEADPNVLLYRKRLLHTLRNTSFD